MRTAGGAEAAVANWTVPFLVLETMTQLTDSKGFQLKRFYPRKENFIMEWRARGMKENDVLVKCAEAHIKGRWKNKR